MDALLRMQRACDASDLPPYDEARLVAEMELMPTWFLQRHLGLDPSCAQWDASSAVPRAGRQRTRQEQVFVHRDYHSRNLLIADAGEPGHPRFPGRRCAARSPTTWCRCCATATSNGRRRASHAWAEAYRQRLVAAGLTAWTRRRSAAAST
jgi:hypothetical protein